MNPKTIAIVNKTQNTDATGIQALLDRILGRQRVNNASNPNSAAYKVAQSVGQPNPYNPQLQRTFIPSLPNQQTFGVPNAQ